MNTPHSGVRALGDEEDGAGDDGEATSLLSPHVSLCFSFASSPLKGSLPIPRGPRTSFQYYSSQQETSQYLTSSVNQGTSGEVSWDVIHSKSFDLALDKTETGQGFPGKCI